MVRECNSIHEVAPRLQALSNGFIPARRYCSVAVFMVRNCKHPTGLLQPHFITAYSGYCHSARDGWVGGNKNVPLDAGSPKLAQRFVSTPSSILPETMSLSTSGRLQSAIL